MTSRQTTIAHTAGAQATGAQATGAQASGAQAAGTLSPRDASPLPEPFGWSQPDLVAPPTGPKIVGLGRAFLRRIKLLLVTVVVLNLLAFWGVHNLTPRYTASADLIVGPREEQVVDLKAVLSGLSGSSDVIESEIQVLRSRKIARSVVQKLNLDQQAEFNPSLRPPGLRQHLAETAEAALLWTKTQLVSLENRLGLGDRLGLDRLGLTGWDLTGWALINRDWTDRAWTGRARPASAAPPTPTRPRPRPSRPIRCRRPSTGS